MQFLNKILNRKVDNFSNFLTGIVIVLLLAACLCTDVARMVLLVLTVGVCGYLMYRLNFASQNVRAGENMSYLIKKRYIMDRFEKAVNGLSDKYQNLLKEWYFCDKLFHYEALSADEYRMMPDKVKVKIKKKHRTMANAVCPNCKNHIYGLRDRGKYTIWKCSCGVRLRSKNK